MKRLLLVEDEEVLAEVMLDNLEEEGYSVSWAKDGEEALYLWQKQKPDIVLLDVMLPKRSGFDVCRAMREQGDHTPVLFLSAKAQPEDRVQGLALGGDDYLTKPFHLPELLLRIHNMLQRQSWHQQHKSDRILAVGTHQVDCHTGEVMLAQGRYAHLQEEELQLLLLFVQKEGQLLDRDTILDHLWGHDVLPSSRTIERLIHRLQQVFEDNPNEPVYFQKFPGMRFRFAQPEKGD